MPALVSVVLPTYNRARTLRRAINSVLNQDYRNIELIVVDDGSQDETRDILNSIDDQRLRIIHHDRNRGLGAARNTGLFASTGEFIAFQDSDDEWLDGKLTSQVGSLEGSAADCICVYCIKIVYGRNPDYVYGHRRIACVPGPEVSKVSGDVREILWRKNLVSTQTILCTRDAALKAGGFDPRLRNSVDWDFVLRLSEQGGFGFVDLPLVNTYIQNDSVSRLFDKAAYSQFIITQKMKRRGVPRAVLAEHWARLGYRMGKRRGCVLRGSVVLRAALTERPWDVKTWLRYIRLHIYR
jgi:glycosyltransferase involved in cell wall biosynthesis